MDAWAELQKQKGKVPGLDKFCDRHLFARFCNRQILAALDESAYTASPALREHLSKPFSRVGSTQVVEDGFNRTKINGIFTNTEEVEQPEEGISCAHQQAGAVSDAPLPGSSA